MVSQEREGRMTAKESQRAGTVCTGLATIVGAYTHAKMTKKWEDFHTLLVVLGAGLTIYGAVA
jgi:hypothetical protein